MSSSEYVAIISWPLLLKTAHVMWIEDLVAWKRKGRKNIFCWNGKTLSGYKPYQMPWNKSLKRFGIFLREISSIKKSYKLIATSCCHKMVEDWIGMDTEKHFDYKKKKKIWVSEKLLNFHTYGELFTITCKLELDVRFFHFFG